jgi:hypothetical protein
MKQWTREQIMNDIKKMVTGRPECNDYFSFGGYVHYPECAIKKLKESSKCLQ